LFLCLLAEGAYWEVDLGRDVDVKKVIIYNRNDGDLSQRLSNSVVSLLSQEGSTLKNYTIGNAKNIAQFEFVWESNDPSYKSSSKPSSDPSFNPNGDPSSNLSSNPSSNPSSIPSSYPSNSFIPSSNPSNKPICNPPSDPSPNPNSTDPTEIPDGLVKLARCSSLCLLTKAILDFNGTLSIIAPLALSYDGRPWEKAGGEYAMKLLYGQEFVDYPCEGSQLSLPHLNNTEKYYLTSYPHRTISEADKVARLLETATFGTTAAELASFDSLTGDAAKRWILNQMSMNLTSHREYFRKRTNTRLNNPVRLGRNGHPCDPGSRWRTYAFSSREGNLDTGNSASQRFEAVKINPNDTYITIKLNGKFEQHHFALVETPTR
jgi:hypothetical protein